MSYDGLGYAELLDALERVSDLNEWELEQDECVDAMLTERQEILDAMAKLDGRALSEDVRASLRERLTAVIARNDAQLAYLGRIREQIREDLDGMVTSRAAVRGYRPAQAEFQSRRLPSL